MYIPFGNMCVQRRRFEVNLIVTWVGSNGLIKALRRRTSTEAEFMVGDDPADPTMGRDIAEGKSLISSVKNKNTLLQYYLFSNLHFVYY